MKKLLVLVQAYPDNEGKVTLMYVHTRNLGYVENGYDVTVLNFSAQKPYIIDGIPVITLKEYEADNNHYDVLVLHAANIRNHYRFLKKYGDKFEKFLFFYHGHEVLKINRDYSKPYFYVKKNFFKKIAQNVYDEIKLSVWKRYIPQITYKSYFVFVSKWMYDKFLENTRIDSRVLEGKWSITYNNVGIEFEKTLFEKDTGINKSYDFVTIRNNLDGSKYAIDYVNELAKRNPEARFLVVGKGKFFSYIEKAENLVWENKTMNHQEIIRTAQTARFALMPTRTDAQGLMMCELAAMGMPVITSDIPVCHEVLDDYPNAFFIKNDDKAETLQRFSNMQPTPVKHKRYFRAETLQHEISILDNLLNK